MLDADHCMLTLAQGPSLAGDSPGGTTGQPGQPGQPGTTGTPDSPFGSSFFFLMMLVLVALIAFSFLGQRKDRKKRESMLSAVKKHDRVQTIGGVIGSIVELKPDVVILKVDESSNTRMTFARSAIQQVLTDDTDASK
jgi:preprotein translocase subunit YajC